MSRSNVRACKFKGCARKGTTSITLIARPSGRAGRTAAHILASRTFTVCDRHARVVLNRIDATIVDKADLRVREP